MADSKLITVKAPSGEFYDIEESKLTPELQAQGFIKANTQEIANYDAKVYADENPIKASALAAGAGLARSASFGLSDPLIEATGIASKEDINALRNENPMSSIGGEVAGFLLPTGLESLAAKGAGSIAKKAAAQFLEKQGTGLAERALAKKVFETAVKEGAEGAVIGARQGITEAYLGNPDQVGENIFSNVGIGALTGGVLGAAAPVVSRGVSKAAESVRGALPDKETIISKVFGVDSDLLKERIKLGKDVSELPNIQGISDEVSMKIKSIRDEFNADKLTLKEAESNYNKVMKEALDDHKLNISDSKESVRALKNEFEQYKQDFLGQSRAKNIDNAKLVAQDVQELANSAIKEASDAKVNLKGVTVDGTVIRQDIEKTLSDLRATGIAEDEKLAKTVEKFLNQNKNIFESATADAEQIKDLIKRYDKIIKWSDFGLDLKDTVANRLNKDIRKAMDRQLKTIPEYATAMKTSSDKFDLIEKLSAYGDENKAMRRLSGIDRGANLEIDLPVLKELEAKVGKNQYTSEIENYANRRNLLNESEASKALNAEQEALSGLQSERAKRSVIEGVEQSAEAQAYNQFKTKFEVSEKALRDLERLTPEGIPALFKKAAKGDVLASEKVKVIENAFNSPELLDSIKKAGTIDAFDKALASNPLGKTLFMSLIGSIIGQTLGLAGGLAGFVAGKVAADMSPSVAKKALDQYIAFQSGEFKSLSKIYQMSENTTKRINDSLVHFAKNGSAPKAIKYTVINLATGKEADSDDKEAFKDNVKIIKDFANNPEMIMDNMTKNFNGLQTVAPEVSAATQATGANALTFLQTKLPPENSQLLFSPKYEPSDFEVDTFNRYLRAVNNPYSVLEDMNNGQISLEGIETLKTIYPKTYENIVGTLTNSLAENKSDLDYNDKVQIAMLFDIPVDDTTSVEFIQTMQDLHSTSANSQPMNRSSGQIDADKLLTQSQRVASR